MKDADRNGYLEGLKLMDQRMAQAEINRQHLKQSIRQTVNHGKDFEMSKLKKSEALLQTKEKAIEERKMIENAVNLANEAEKKKIEERRMKLKNIAVESRK